MKKAIALMLALLCVCAVFTACGGSDKKDDSNAAKDEKTNETTEIVIFAAASMTETLEELAKVYEADHPDVKLTFNFDSSGTLKTQIEEGAVCDLFISAAQKQMDGLQDGSYVNTDTRLDLLENKVALCVPEGNPKNIQSYDDLAEKLGSEEMLMAMGNEDVPVGQYTQKILACYNLDEADLASAGKITYGSNVKEVTTQVSEGTVDCGIIYQTDAYSANLEVIDTATEAMCGQVIYPAAVLSGSKNADEAKAFLTFLQTEEASKVFEKVGFTPLATK